MFYTYHPSCVAHGGTNIWPGVDSIDDRSPRRYLPTATSTFLVLPEDAVMINLRTRPVNKVTSLHKYVVKHKSAKLL